MEYLKNSIPVRFGTQPLFAINANECIVGFNHAALKITGLSPNALTGKYFNELFNEPVDAATMLRKVFDTGEVNDITLSLRLTSEGVSTRLTFSAFHNKVAEGEIQILATASL